ncbi:alpha-N-acetylneuraminide alpha-2,8-sialyltransferase-like [Antedon mediterranea]|uniref:alpha-N-acetylneuraminide alpha-2,8-sialyltransferase-like n=1 Tax=Antedon mediterranea TaxID=105859 RepID=UPI003AF7F6FD
MKTRHRLACVTIMSPFLLYLWWWKKYELSIYNGVQNFGNPLLPNQELQKLVSESSKTKNPELIGYQKTVEKLKYIMNVSIDNESTHHVSTIFNTTWQQNISNLQDIRSDLKKYVHTGMILNQKQVRTSQRFDYLLMSGGIGIREKFHRTLPKYSLEKNVYKRCSIVGNGGILNRSKCGKEIDKADFVIRCNAPPIDQFREDAGVKSNLTTVNPSIIKDRFGNAKKIDQQSKLINKMKEYTNYIFFPSFASDWIYGLSIRLNDLLNSKLRSAKLVHGNPNHFKAIRAYWSNKGIHTFLSTGFYLTTSSLLFCNEIHLYGFWPFFTDIHNRPTPYHYFENVELKRSRHAFDKEFNELAKLHSDGVLQLHVDDCSVG